MEDPIDLFDFKNRHDWRAWLEKNNASESQAWLVIHKKGSSLEGMRLDEAVEEALCYGWIDSTLRRRDKYTYLLRFTPRRPDSVWSMHNIKRVDTLLRSGVMREAGMAKVREAKASGQWQAAIDREHPDQIPSDLETALCCKKGALAGYRGLSDSQKKQFLFWIQSAKRKDTRRKRIAEIVTRVVGE